MLLNIDKTRCVAEDIGRQVPYLLQIFFLSSQDIPLFFFVFAKWNFITLIKRTALGAYTLLKETSNTTSQLN